MFEKLKNHVNGFVLQNDLHELGDILVIELPTKRHFPDCRLRNTRVEDNLVAIDIVTIGTTWFTGQMIITLEFFYRKELNILRVCLGIHVDGLGYLIGVPFFRVGFGGHLGTCLVHFAICAGRNIAYDQILQENQLSI